MRASPLFWIIILLSPLLKHSLASLLALSCKTSHTHFCTSFSSCSSQLLSFFRSTNQHPVLTHAFQKTQEILSCDATPCSPGTALGPLRPEPHPGKLYFPRQVVGQKSPLQSDPQTYLGILSFMIPPPSLPRLKQNGEESPPFLFPLPARLLIHAIIVFVSSL